MFETKSTVSVHETGIRQGDSSITVEEPNTVTFTQNIAQPHTEVPNVTNIIHPEHEVHQQEKVESLKKLKVCNQVLTLSCTFKATLA